MFVGHLAVALAAKQRAPTVNLGWLIFGVIAADLIWPILLLAGVEQVRIAPGATAFTPFVFEHYPWSHSLVMMMGWGLLLVAVARAARLPASVSVLLVLLVVSHWGLDFITHAPDMPLWPGDSPRFGLTLWNSIPGTILVEGALWVAAIVIYLRMRAQKGERPGWAFWSLVGVSTVLWLSGPFQPPPPSVRVIGWFGLVGWIVVPWAAWADRSRR
jgi:membrane-bound metal-dependent hydrolase YbcI (DUF457 family)